MASLNSVATDCGSLILSFLDASYVCRLSNTSKRFKTCCDRSLATERPVGFCFTIGDLDDQISSEETYEHKVDQKNTALSEMLKRCPRATRFYELQSNVANSVDQAVDAKLPIHRELIHSDLAQFPSNTKFPSLRSLAIHHPSFPAATLHSTFPDLQQLSIHQTQAILTQYPFPMHILSKECPNVTALTFHAVSSTVSTCISDKIALPETLTDVRFVDMKFSTSLFLEFVKVLPATLRVLWMDTMETLNEEASEVIGNRYTQLEELRSSKLGHEAASKLLTSLKSLTSLHECPLSVFCRAARFSNILKITVCWPLSGDARAAQIQLLHKLPNLTWLKLMSTVRCLSLIEPLALRYKRLQHLSITCLTFSKACIRSLRFVTTLRALDLLEARFIRFVRDGHVCEFDLLAETFHDSNLHTLGVRGGRSDTDGQFVERVTSMVRKIPTLKLLECNVRNNAPSVAKELEDFREKHDHPRCIKVNDKITSEYAHARSAGRSIILSTFN